MGSVLTAAAQNAGMYIAGHILQGLATSMMLIAAAPPLTIGYPKDKLRHTAVIMNMCVFGAVALGPFIGGVQAEAHAWRPLFWIVAAIALMALVLAALTFDDAPRPISTHRGTCWAIALASVGCAAAFVGASQLTSHGFTDVAVTVPMFGGLALIVVLIVYQFRARRPLLTDPYGVDQFDPGSGRRGRAVRRGRLGSGDRSDRQRVAGDLQPGPGRAAVSARTRRCRRDGGRVRDRHHPTRDALPPPRRHGIARRRASWCSGSPSPPTSRWRCSARR